MVSLEWRSLRVTEESSKVLKVGLGGYLIMTAESRRRKAVPPRKKRGLVNTGDISPEIA